MQKLIDYIEKNYPSTVMTAPEDDGTLIGLPHPFTVPNLSNFKELYYWDTYFINEGLLSAGYGIQAKNNVDNILYLVEKFGFMPNGNRTYYLKQSQPPFLSLMVLSVYECTHDIKWLESAYKTLEKEYKFWMTKRVCELGLNHYKGDLADDSVDFCVGELANRVGLKIAEDITEAEKKRLAQSCMAFWECGWDCNSRFGLYAHEIAPVDLNSLMFAFESNMAYFSMLLGNDRDIEWQEKAEHRRELMNKYMWNEEKGAYYDYDYVQNKQSELFSGASFYPLFSGIADEHQADATHKNLGKIEFEYGISASEKPSGEFHAQWDYPNLWAPVTYMVARGLINYGYIDDAKRVSKKYMDIVERVFEKTGRMWEKYDAVTGEMSAGCEYATPELFGWTAWIYMRLKNLLGEI